ncbi:MAG: hemolysin III family protein [Planctomycetes bacterium]|nr:hemolysin III family protein [Planctomycetota bacterium]MBT7011489.1 hemolysin III family protein [Planctomycetota bacterium]
MTPAASYREDVVNASIHGFGFLASLAALPWLLSRALSVGDIWSAVGAAVFGVGLVFLLLASTTYHFAKNPFRKVRLRLVDHAMIFIFIAMAYTPFCLTALRETWAVWLLPAAWVCAIAGVIFKLFAKSRFHVATVPLYLAMAWMAVAAIHPMQTFLPPASFSFLLAAGASFTIGTIFYALDKRVGFHAVWHVAVLVGCGCLTGSVFYVLPAAL